MSLAEFIMAGRAFADMMDQDGTGKPPPSDDDFDAMLAAAAEKGMLQDAPGLTR